MIDITTNYLGMQLKNPIVVGSSSMTGSVDEIIALEHNGAAAVVLKSIFEEEILSEANYKIDVDKRDEPVYSQLINTLDYINTYSNHKKLSEYIAFIRDLKKTVKIPVIASINCISDGVWVDYLSKIAEAGADALEIHVFQIRSGLTGLNYEKTIHSIVKKVTEKVSLPVSIKLSNCFANQGQVITKLSKSGIAGLVLFDRSYSFDIDIYNLNNTSGKMLSKSDDYYQSLKWIALMSGKVGCNLTAATGIHHADAVIKEILAGADAVQIVSTLYLNGKDYIRQILHDLENWMNEKGFFSLKQVRGLSSYKNISDPVVYERVEFMKYYGRIR